MRPATNVEPIALSIDGDLFILGNDVFDDLDLECFTDIRKRTLRVFSAPDFSFYRQIAADDFLHAHLYGGKVIG